VDGLLHVGGGGIDVIGLVGSLGRKLRGVGLLVVVRLRVSQDLLRDRPGTRHVVIGVGLVHLLELLPDRARCLAGRRRPGGVGIALLDLLPPLFGALLAAFLVRVAVTGLRLGVHRG